MVNSMPISLLLIFFLHIKMLKGCPSFIHKHLPHSLTRIPHCVHFHTISLNLFLIGGKFLYSIALVSAVQQRKPCHFYPPVLMVGHLDGLQSLASNYQTCMYVLNILSSDHT